MPSSSLCYLMIDRKHDLIEDDTLDKAASRAMQIP